MSDRVVAVMRSIRLDSPGRERPPPGRRHPWHVTYARGDHSGRSLTVASLGCEVTWDGQMGAW